MDSILVLITEEVITVKYIKCSYLTDVVQGIKIEWIGTKALGLCLKELGYMLMCLMELQQN